MRSRTALLKALRDDLDESRVQHALDDGLITHSQAAELQQFIRVAKRPKVSRISVVQTDDGFAGEVGFDGTSWLGFRYGADYPTGVAFGSEDEARKFVAERIHDRERQRFSSVWDAVECSPEAAHVMRLRSFLMLALRAHIERRRLSQADAGKLLGLSAPSVFDLVSGKVEAFDLETLVRLAAVARLRVEIGVAE